MKSRVLVVDDDTALAEMIGLVLKTEGFDPVFCADGDAAIGVFRSTSPDLVLLDLMLPGKDGTEVCRQIRAESGVPVIMLTAKSDTLDVVQGLESGADDYISKPFKPKELVARIRARLRRTDEPAPERLTIGDLEIDVTGHRVTRAGTAISLTPSSSTCWSPSPASRGRCSPARSCSRRSGVTGTRPTPASSTSTCSVCGPRSSTTPRSPRSC